MAGVTRPGKPLWPKVNPTFVREALAGHSLLGLGLGALIYLVCLSGSLVVFVADLRAWEQPRAPHVERVSAAAIDRAIAHGLDTPGIGQVSTVYVMLPRLAAGRTTVEAYGAKGHAAAWVGSDGRAFLPAATPWSDFADALHMYLTLPTSLGLIVVGLAGVALLSLLISGLLAHPRIFRDAFALRWGGAKRVQEADLHNRLSVWGLSFHLAVTLTGAFLGLSNLLLLAVAATVFHGDTTKAYAPLAGPTAHAAASAAPRMAGLMARLGVTDPGRQIDYVGVERPGASDQRITVETAAPDRLPRGERWYFDGQGRLIGQGGYVHGAVGAQAYAAAAALHFGSFGGVAVRVVYGVLGLALTVICASGISIWLARRRAAGRPAPRWEKLWAGWVWGAPLALAMAALLSQTANAPPTPCFWGLAILFALISLTAPSGAQVLRFGKALLGLASLALVAVNLAHGGGLAFHPTVLIDSALVALALALFAAVRSTGSTAPARPTGPAPRKRR